MTPDGSTEVYVYCNECRENILLGIPVSNVEQRSGGLLAVLSTHGEPEHSVLFYLDKEFKVRGTERPSILKDLAVASDSKVPEAKALPGSKPSILSLEKILDYFGDKQKHAIGNLSHILTQMILGNNIYLVESKRISAQHLSEFIRMLFTDQNASLEVIVEGENERIRGAYPVVFDLENKKMLTDGINIKTYYFEQLLKNALSAPDDMIGLQNELSKIFYSYTILQAILKADNERHLDTKLAEQIAIDLDLMPLLLKMIESAGIRIKDRIEYDGLGRAIRSF